jgi:hypothetical protein
VFGGTSNALEFLPLDRSGNLSEKTMNGFVEITEQMELPF